MCKNDVNKFIISFITSSIHFTQLDAYVQTSEGFNAFVLKALSVILLYILLYTFLIKPGGNHSPLCRAAQNSIFPTGVKTSCVLFQTHYRCFLFLLYIPFLQLFLLIFYSLQNRTWISTKHWVSLKNNVFDISVMFRCFFAFLF